MLNYNINILLIRIAFYKFEKYTFENTKNIYYDKLNSKKK